MGDFPYQVAYFGKLPGFGDFVRYNAGGGEVRIFEQWIQEGLYFSQKQYAQEWNSLYPDSPTHCFMFAPPEGALCLLGILKASRDILEISFSYNSMNLIDGVNYIKL